MVHTIANTFKEPVNKGRALGGSRRWKAVGGEGFNGTARHAQYSF